MLLNPRLGGAFKDPYTFHEIKDSVINNPILPGTLKIWTVGLDRICIEKKAKKEKKSEAF